MPPRRRRRRRHRKEGWEFPRQVPHVAHDVRPDDHSDEIEGVDEFGTIEQYPPVVAVISAVVTTIPPSPPAPFRDIIIPSPHTARAVILASRDGGNNRRPLSANVAISVSIIIVARDFATAAAVAATTTTTSEWIFRQVRGGVEVEPIGVISSIVIVGGYVRHLPREEGTSFVSSLRAFSVVCNRRRHRHPLPSKSTINPDSVLQLAVKKIKFC
jgi:hypothetical protein